MKSSSRSLGLSLGVIAVLGDGNAFDEFHDEVGRTFKDASIEDLGDVRVIHQGQGLAFLLKACQQAFAVAARFDQLDGDPALYRFFLISDVDGAHATFAELFAELVGADLVERLFE